MKIAPTKLFLAKRATAAEPPISIKRAKHEGKLAASDLFKCELKSIWMM